MSLLPTLHSNLFLTMTFSLLLIKYEFIQISLKVFFGGARSSLEFIYRMNGADKNFMHIKMIETCKERMNMKKSQKSFTNYS